MKHLFTLKTIMLACLLFVGMGAWADSYTITFKTGSNDGTSVSTSTKCSDLVTAGSDYLSGNLATATSVYNAGGSGLKLGTSGGSGTLKMNLSETGKVSATSIVVRAKQYNSSKATKIALNGKTAQNLSADFADYTFTLNSDITYLELVSSKGTSGGAYCWIESITVNYTAGGGTKYNVNIANDIVNGTVTATPTSAAEGATVTLTATPNTGYEFGSWNVTDASSNSITVTNNQFTMPAANVNVSATFNQIVSLATVSEIYTAATTAGSTATDCYVTFNNYVVSGVKGNNAYITDNAGKGFIIYGSGHGFVAGDILNGTVACKVQLYNGSAELTTLTSSTNGLTVTKGGVVTPVTSVALASLSGVNTGAVLSYENLQYDGTNFTDGETTLKPYNTFITLPTLISGKNYDVTGVYIQYNATKEIAPRTAEDFVLNEVINKYVVSFDVTENGTITVKDGETVINEGDEVAEGTTLTIECTPANADYRFKNWQYKEEGGTWNSRQTNPQNYTMPSANVQFRANFELIPVYTVAWSVNGVEVKSEDLKEGAAVTAPDVDAPAGKVFLGWATAEIVGTTNVAPELVTPAATATAAVTYYAVFATQNVTGNASLTKLDGNSTLNTGDEIVVIAQSDDNYYGMYQETVSTSYVNYFVLNHEPVYSDVSDDAKKSWTLTAAQNNTWNLGDATNGFLVGSTNNLYANTNGDKSAYTIAWNSTESKFTIKNGDRWVACRADLTGDNQYKYRGAGNQNSPTTGSVAYFDFYRLTRSVITYSDYCTTVAAPVYNEQSLTLAATDGYSYYATFSSSSVTFWPSMDGDLEYATEVAKVSVDGSALTITNLDEEEGYDDLEGFFVPANTGVLVMVDFDKAEKTVPYYTVTNKNVAALEGNALVAGTGSTPTDGDEFKYYKLAYDAENVSDLSTLGFYWGANEGAPFSLSVGKAYLKVAKTDGVKGFRFGGNTTGIKTLNNEQFANKAVKRIVNGQLVIEKAGKMFNAAGAEMK